MKKIIWTIIVIIVIILIVVGVLSNKPSSDVSSANSIKIGADFALTGYGASWAENNRDGAQLAINEINQAGGVLGRNLELVVQDNQSSSRGAVDVASKFINTDQIKYILTAWSEFTVPVIPLLEQNSVIGIGVSVGDPSVAEKSPWFFDVWPRDGFLSQASADYVKERGLKKVAIFSTIGSWENSVVPVFKEQISKNGLTLVASESADPTKTDFKTQISKIKASSPDVIYIQALEPSAGTFIRQARQLGLGMPIIYATALDPSLVDAAGGLKALEGLAYPVYKSSTPEFLEKFKKEYGREAGVSADTAYDSVNVLAEAIKRANSDDPQKVKDQLQKIADFPGASGNITFDMTRNRGKADVILMVVKDGQSVPLHVN